MVFSPITTIPKCIRLFSNGESCNKSKLMVMPMSWVYKMKVHEFLFIYVGNWGITKCIAKV
jgi:hypothetical protein